MRPFVEILNDTPVGCRLTYKDAAAERAKDKRVVEVGH